MSEEEVAELVPSFVPKQASIACMPFAFPHLPASSQRAVQMRVEQEIPELGPLFLPKQAKNACVPLPLTHMLSTMKVATSDIR